MKDLHQVLQAIVTVLAVINPVVCGSLFLTLTPNLTAPERQREAAKVALNILIILIASALVGLEVLSIFGISLDVFRVVGGMIIAYMGFDMLRGSHTVARAPPDEWRRGRSGLTCTTFDVCSRSWNHYGRCHTGSCSHARWFANNGNHRRCRWCWRNIFGVDPRCSAWTSSRPKHASDGHALHGAHRSINGNAVRAGRPKGIV